MMRKVSESQKKVQKKNFGIFHHMLTTINDFRFPIKTFLLLGFCKHPTCLVHGWVMQSLTKAKIVPSCCERFVPVLKS